MNISYKIFVGFCILFFCIIITENVSLAEDCSEITLPGQKCKTKPLSNWTPQEKWVWDQVCEGKIADLNHRFGNEKTLDPKKQESWEGHENRILTPRFLRTILLFEPFVCSHTERGVRIVGAWIKDSVDLAGGNIQCILWIADSLFGSYTNLSQTTFASLVSFVGSNFRYALNMDSSEFKRSLLMREASFKEVNLGNAKIDGQLSLISSNFNGSLNMNAVKIGGSLLMTGRSKFKDVDLRGVEIGGQLTMNGSTFDGMLNMDSAKIEGIILMREGAKFKEVNLRGVDTNGQLEINDATFDGLLYMNNAKIKGAILIGGGTNFQEVDLHGAEIGGQLSMCCSTFNCGLNMDSAIIKRDFLVRYIKFSKTCKKKDEANKINMAFIQIDGSLDLKRANFPNLYLLGANIGGELNITEPNGTLNWLPGAELDLRNAKVARLVASPNLYNLKNVNLNGFQYQSLGGFIQKQDDSLSSDKTALFIKEWLSKSKIPSLVDYKELAQVLNSMGLREQARQISYEGQYRQMLYDWEIKHYASAIWLTFLWVFIGYGYRVWYTLIWTSGFLLLGWYFALKSKIMLPNSKEILGFWYSIDRFLPIIELRKLHYNIDLYGGYRIYFYVHTLMGYLIITLLLAGLSGLVG